jgi:hypothetical protein
MAVKTESCPQCGGRVPLTYGDRVACPYCASSLVRVAPREPAPPSTGADSAPPEASSVWGVRMKRVQLPDARSGVPVFEWLIPADWEFEGAVRWRDSVAMPALIGFRAWNPGGHEQIECLPQIPNTWTRNIVTKALGRFGPKRHLIKFDGLEQREPLSSREALRDLVVPRYRGRTAEQRAGTMRGGLLGFLDPEQVQQMPGVQQYMDGVRQRMQMLQQRVHQAQDLLKGADILRRLRPQSYASPDVAVQFVEEEALPQLAASLRQESPDMGPAPSADGARVRIRYALDGREMEEDIFCVVSSLTTQTGSGLLAEEQVHWVAESLFAFRADRGHLDPLTRACMASVKSVRMNPRWFMAYQAESRRILQERIAMQQALQQMAAAQRASFQRSMHRLSDVSRTLSETSDMIYSGYESRSASYDRMSDNWSEAMRGVDSYVTSGGGASVELPGGYEHAWTNGLGEYVVTDSSFLNPNDFASGSWERLQRGR